MERIVVVGASAGGVEALARSLARLAPDFSAPLLLVAHLLPADDALVALLDEAGPLSAQIARDGEPLAPGRLYLAVRDRHLMVSADAVRVTRGTRENGFRPSVDVLFRSAAYAWGARAIGVVLSGGLADGASGLHAIKAMGGIAVVQTPEDAAYTPMPTHALRGVAVDHVATAEAIGDLLNQLVRAPAPAEAADAGAHRERLALDIAAAAGESLLKKGIMNAKPTAYTCPDCHGVMFEVGESGERRFRCHTGHGYTASALLPRLLDSTEDRVWDALRALQEAAALMRETVGALERAGDGQAAAEMRRKVDAANRRLEALQGMAIGEVRDRAE